ncbi:hypothetical protein [Roseiconus lacunae]|uniref:DUF202 domain-containing protein n=1 Tax=Roseiconus lacunae TaxID=2605694 RepID=A0ABT7PSQ3_9BACT|nr:hypothetical protein [Roseiconus lacunae]MDM4019540.1 hypothetical protein [Roseiconus lacunae]
MSKNDPTEHQKPSDSWLLPSYLRSKSTDPPGQRLLVFRNLCLFGSFLVLLTTLTRIFTPGQFVFELMAGALCLFSCLLFAIIFNGKRNRVVRPKNITVSATNKTDQTHGRAVAIMVLAVVMLITMTRSIVFSDAPNALKLGSTAIPLLLIVLSLSMLKRTAKTHQRGQDR